MKDQSEALATNQLLTMSDVAQLNRVTYFWPQIKMRQHLNQNLKKGGWMFADVAMATVTMDVPAMIRRFRV